MPRHSDKWLAPSRCRNAEARPVENGRLACQMPWAGPVSKINIHLVRPALNTRLVTRFSATVLRAGLVLCLVLCTSCVHQPVKDRGSAPTPGKFVGRPGCSPPISYQVFEKDAFGADWSKANNLLAYNAKGSDGRFHIYTVRPDGTNPQPFGAGGANIPQRNTGTPLWSPSEIGRESCREIVCINVYF
jgi:hypothetical protein